MLFPWSLKNPLLRMSIAPVLEHGLKSEVGGLCRAAMNRTFNNLHSTFWLPHLL